MEGEKETELGVVVVVVEGGVLMDSDGAEEDLIAIVQRDLGDL